MIRIQQAQILQHLNNDVDLAVDRSALGRTAEQLAQDIAIDMGDAFAVDPFDILWESSLHEDMRSKMTELPAVANTAQNSGVEYELLSSLARIHAQSESLWLGGGLTDGVQNSRIGLIDTMPTPNELTLPGDHEIVFVLYTGDYGNQMVSDNVPQGVNPPIAGCHIKASIEINRPSERYDSQKYSERSNPAAGIHYGSTTNLNDDPIPLVTVDSAEGSFLTTGLHTFSVAGGRPSLDLAVYDEAGNLVDNDSRSDSLIESSGIPDGNTITP